MSPVLFRTRYPLRDRIVSGAPWAPPSPRISPVGSKVLVTDEAITSPAPPETFEDLADRIPDESFDSTLGA